MIMGLSSSLMHEFAFAATAPNFNLIFYSLMVVNSSRSSCSYAKACLQFWQLDLSCSFFMRTAEISSIIGFVIFETPRSITLPVFMDIFAHSIPQLAFNACFLTNLFNFSSSIGMLLLLHNTIPTPSKWEDAYSSLALNASKKVLSFRGTK